MAEHRHEFQGQALVHSHLGGEQPHGYFEHPEDGTQLEAAAQAAAEDMAWEKVREHLRAAVVYGLDHYGGHARGGAVADREAWRAATPENLAEAITTFAMAGIGPVLSGEQVTSGVRLMRAVLARAGIDPAGLPWHEAAKDVQP